MMNSVSDLYLAAKTAIVDRRYEYAYRCLIDLIKLQDNFADAYFLLSRIACEFKNHAREIELLHKSIAIDPENPGYYAHLSKAYATSGDLKKAYDFLKLACQFENEDSLALDAIGAAYNRLNMYKEASGYFRKATFYNKNNCGMYFNLGATLKFCGDFPGARDAFEKAIALSPDYYKAHAALTSLGGITTELNHIDRLTSLLSGITDSDDFLHICHALSKELEALGRYDDSFSFLSTGKQKKLESLTYEFEKDRDTFSALKKYFSVTDSIGESKTIGHGSLFVVGMPRTGTTLVERILSNHSQVATAGELHNFGLIAKSLTRCKSNALIDVELIEQSKALDYQMLGRLYIESTAHLKQGCTFLVDKLPLNVLYAGHIIRALPAAKIICLVRNPLDTVFSNYRQLFSFNDMSYAYSLSLKTAAQYYIEFKHLVDFWQSRFPDNFMVVNYEDLVVSPDVEIKKLLEYCQLPWEEHCLAMEKNKNPVATASSVQVRNPITDKSVGQWKNYQAYAGGIKGILQGLL